ncbi:general transcriptional corepressor trfA-like [Odontomachus brunneus]|uniref:general transcriptional corepressor trfA-like n=1 Tax=Odontomachus brunneus TaxID=486640 RepID=UPI0013F193BD|nr:general transcriptional corepressor trfA-like [Odontomachus brunneus]
MTLKYILSQKKNRFFKNSRVVLPLKMNKRKLKHVADITSRQFRRRVYAAVRETRNKVEYMTSCNNKNRNITNDNNGPSNTVSSNATSNAEYEEDAASNILNNYSDVYRDNFYPENYDELSNHGMYEYEKYQHQGLDTSDLSEEIEDDPINIDSDEIEENSDKATLQLKNFLRMSRHQSSNQI